MVYVLTCTHYYLTPFNIVFSRLWVLYAVLDATPPEEVTDNYFLYLTCASWSLVEVPRYLFYTMNLSGLGIPYVIFWLRYSLFGILYPTGITGELGSTYRLVMFLYHHPEVCLSAYALPL